MRKSHLAITQARGTSRIVGGFFEELACKILNGERCQPEQGDFVHWEPPGFIAEVKASDNNHSFRISKTQFLEQKKEIGWIFENHLYVLCKYNNRQGRKKGRPRKSILHRFRDADSIRTYLAHNTVRMHILDRSIVLALEKRFYPQGVLPLGLDGEESIEINHRMLENFSNPKKTSEWIKHLGLQKISIVSFCLSVPHVYGLIQTHTRVTVTTVLPYNVWKHVDSVLFQKAVAA